eukprot:3322635-Pleurochrysis_carterae.AAC.1
MVATTPDSPSNVGRRHFPSSRHCQKRQLRSCGQPGRGHDRDRLHCLLARRRLCPCLAYRAYHLQRPCHGHHIPCFGHQIRLERTLLARLCRSPTV